MQVLADVERLVFDGQHDLFELVLVAHLDEFLDQVVAERVFHQDGKIADCRLEDDRADVIRVDLGLQEAAAALILRQRHREEHECLEILVAQTFRAFQGQACRP